MLQKGVKFPLHSLWLGCWTQEREMGRGRRGNLFLIQISGLVTTSMYSGFEQHSTRKCFNTTRFRTDQNQQFTCSYSNFPVLHIKFLKKLSHKPLYVLQQVLKCHISSPEHNVNYFSLLLFELLINPDTFRLLYLQEEALKENLKTH